MNMAQKRAYIILHAELTSFNFKPDSVWVIPKIIRHANNILKGKKVTGTYLYSNYETKFVREVQKILHLTTISIEHMIVVLEELIMLWGGYD